MRFLIDHITSLLRWSEKYTKTDMIYLAGSGWWMALGTIVLSFGSLILYIVFAHTLPKEVYGTYQYLISAGAIIGAFTLTGMNTAVARAVAQGYEGVLRRAVRAQLLFGIIPFLIGAGGSLYYFIQNNTLLSIGFLLLGIFVPLINAFNTYGAFLHGKKDFKRGFFYGLVWNIPYYAILVGISFVAPFALALLFGSLLVQALATGYLLNRVLRLRVHNDTHDKDALEYGKHLSVMNLPTTVATQIDAILAFHFLGAAPLALYSFATAIPERLSGLFKFIPTAALPKLSEKNPEEIRAILGKSRIWFAVVALLFAALGYALIAPYLFMFLFPTYTDAIPFSQWYGLIFLTVIGNLFVTGLTAQRDIKDLYIYNVASPSIQILFQFFGIIFYGLWGLVVGRLISMGFSILLASALLFKRRDP